MTNKQRREKLNQLTQSYDHFIIDELHDKKFANLYLQTALEQFQQTKESEPLLIALRYVAQAQGGIGKLAEKTHLNRESLYKTLSSKGNPKLSTLSTLLHALGFQLSIQPYAKI